MGAVNAPEPVELPLPGGDDVVRGLCWRGDATWIVLLHAPDGASDLDAWGNLPERLAARGPSVLALDLPGHGLSGGDLRADALPALSGTALDFIDRRGGARVLAVAAGAAIGALCHWPSKLPLAALVAVSPVLTEAQADVLPPVPKLIVVGVANRRAAEAAERCFRRGRDWTVLSSFAGAENGHALLAGPRGEQATEQILAFLEDYR